MTASPAMPIPTPIPLPPDFPIEWPDPALAQMFWQRDRMHSPGQTTPMSGWMLGYFERGFNAGLQANGMPMRAGARRFNTYFYLAVNPALPPDQMAEVEPEVQARMQEASARFWQRWEQEWLPELQRGWDEWEARGHRSMDDADFDTFIEWATAWYERAWTIHFELIPPAMMAASLFQDLYSELFPGSDPLAAYRLTQGFDNMSLEAGRKLWQIAEAARSDTGLRHVVETTPADELWARLDASSAGRALKEQLQGYLAYYGRRSDNVQELSYISWTEDPRPALENLKAYVSGGEDPDITLHRLAAQREEAVATARAALSEQPPGVRGQFEGLLAAAQGFARVQEDHNFWIDQRSLHEMRQLCLELGRRLQARGLLTAVDDVFLLRMEEARAALRGEFTNVAAIVVERRAEMDRWANTTAPPVIGTDYGPPPDNPIARGLMRFFGGPPRERTVPDELRGNPGSPGKVIGTARVIRAITDAGRLRQGDILVTTATAPPWTPYFATAAAVVTETGGVLSHCAIVAREYGIPAVVGTAGACSAITDGATIEVDGDHGIVRIQV